MATMTGEEKVVGRDSAGPPRGFELLANGDIAVAGTGHVGRSPVGRAHIMSFRVAGAGQGDCQEQGGRWPIEHGASLENEVQSGEDRVVVHDDLHVRDTVAIQIRLNPQI